MKFIYSLAALCLFTFIVACKKKDGVNKHLDPNQQEGSNYMSTTPGSWWLFGARNGDVTKRVATGRDTVKNGLKFSYFEKIDTNTAYIAPEYFGKNGINYVSLFDMDGGQNNYVTLVFLQDDHTSWENTEDYTYEGIKMNLWVKSSIAFSDGSLTLGGATYDKVTKVHHELKGKPQMMASYIDIGTLDVWFAKGIGIIMEDVNVNISLLGTTYVEMKHTDSLLSYHIAE